MRSRRPKVLHPLCGRPILAYVLDAARAVTSDLPVVVISPATAEVAAQFAGAARFALQDEPRGTADALRAALELVGPDVSELLVLSGDVPLVPAETLRELLALRRRDGAAMALVAARGLPVEGLGRVVRAADGSVERVVEERDAADPIRAIDEVNAGIYAVDAEWVRRRIAAVSPSPASGELYLTELVALARADGRRVSALSVGDGEGRLAGINDRRDLALAAARLRREIVDRHLRAGVTMEDPATAYIDATVELEADVTLEPFVVLRGATRIGSGTVVGAGSQISDSVVGRDCRVWASVLEGCRVGDRVTIGPFSHLRPGTVVDEGAEIGNYAELKNTHLGPGVKQHHVSYLGDAEVGEGTNVGAGTITANFDGVRKHRTTIGRRVFLGVDTMLRAPVTLGDGARTGAGAVVTRDVPPGKLAVGVPARLREPRTTEAAPAPGAPSDGAGEIPDRGEASGEAGGDPGLADGGSDGSEAADGLPAATDPTETPGPAVARREQPTREDDR
jgi:bifunctional UDP-N-acetylglucosamine pyrophosphorylase/glucosamine-1-phosphate N-acetyltransferase